jgi:hypothetical protein
VPDGVDVVVVIASADVPAPPGVRETPVGVNASAMLGSLGELVAARLILPVSPRLLRVTVELADLPATNVPGVTVCADNVKSGFTVTRTETVCDSEPLLPVTVIL